MINFILPNFYHNYTYNQKIINYYNNAFFGIEGAFDFSIFNGRINNNCKSDFVAYENIVNSIQSYQAISNNLTIIDFGNMMLEDTDYFDTFGEVVLEELAKKDNIYFEVSQPNFIEYLLKYYPDIKIILHENYTIFHSETEIQNLINKYPNIKGINITILNPCLNVCVELKIGILNLDSCFYCRRFPLCLKNEHKNILRYRKASIFNECQRKKLINKDKLIENLKILLNVTNEILVTGFADEQINDYIFMFEEILKAEREL